ncbi:hypothetical protein [Galbitalea soli]|uniref:Uncharacterized protein n=1 Tax=Galbitalea soli TaxID=1268042 RepID=A0A7C9PMJ8_9MICO|nr:hypothetical protein [Galbitalea soli]NEM90972.1 hypothetical protein [Galbitalea soli]NYJ29659.1 hypothetical protein [Galbitalea soli]
MTVLSRLQRARRILAMLAAASAFAIAAVGGLAPPAPPTEDAILRAYSLAHAQEVAVADSATGTVVRRDGYTASPGYETLKEGGTNYDWANLILLYGGWPRSDVNVTVLLRWMRQENGPPNWWNRNNPLNNGYGSGGNAGTGSYPNLMVAAQKVAENLKRLGAFHPIVAALVASSSTSDIEHAIWASPWAASHYANGTHWAYFPVPIVKAPASAWG